MTTEEKIFDLQRNSAVMDEKINSLMIKIDATSTRIDDFISEMRQQNEIRANENVEIRQNIREIYQTMDEKIESIRQSVDKNGRNQTIITLLGIGAMVVAVLLK